MPYALCSMLYAVPAVSSSPCAMLYALCILKPGRVFMASKNGTILHPPQDKPLRADSSTPAPNQTTKPNRAEERQRFWEAFKACLEENRILLTVHPTNRIGRRGERMSTYGPPLRENTRMQVKSGSGKCVPGKKPCRRSEKRKSQEASPGRKYSAKGGLGGEHQQTVRLPYFAAFVRHSSSGSALRHSGNGESY